MYITRIFAYFITSTVAFCLLNFSGFTFAAQAEQDTSEQQVIIQYIEIFQGLCIEYDQRLQSARNAINSGQIGLALQILNSGFWYPDDYFKMLKALQSMGTDGGWATAKIAQIQSVHGFARSWHESELFMPAVDINRRRITYELNAGILPADAINQLGTNVIFLDCNVIFQLSMYKLLLGRRGAQRFNDHFIPRLQHKPLLSPFGHQPVYDFEILLAGPRQTNYLNQEGADGHDGSDNEGLGGYAGGSSSSETSDGMAAFIKFFDANGTAFPIDGDMFYEVNRSETDQFKNRIEPGVATFIANHPAYGHKFGGLGTLGGINVLCVGHTAGGKPLFSGLGLPRLEMTAEEIATFLISAFNKNSSEEILPQVLPAWWQLNEGNTYLLSHLAALQNAEITATEFYRDGGGWAQSASLTMPDPQKILGE